MNGATVMGIDESMLSSGDSDAVVVEGNSNIDSN